MAAREALRSATDVYTPIDSEFTAKNAEYVKKRAENDAAVLAYEAEQEQAEEALSPNLVDSPVIDGMVASPKAIQALNYALSKVNIAWYVWGDEGPDTFDCSGLAYWAYGKVGVTVPRVAADMYHGTHAIRATKDRLGDQLLPGDLVYFATDKGDWRTIYHMGIYIGGGKMVNAPTSGQKVKIAEVKWSRFFGATRIFDAVGSPNATQTPAPTATSASPVPTSTSASPSPSSSQSPSATPSASPSESHSPSPTKSAEPSASASLEPSKEPTKEPTKEPSKEPSADPTTKQPSSPASSAAAASKPAVVESSAAGASTAAHSTSAAAAN